MKACECLWYILSDVSIFLLFPITGTACHRGHAPNFAYDPVAVTEILRNPSTRPMEAKDSESSRNKMRAPSFCQGIDETRRNSTKLDESSLVVVSFESLEIWVDESRDELRVHLVFLDVLSKLHGAVPKLKEHFLRCIPHQAHDSQHCICPWMLFQQLHFVLVAFILMGRSDLDDVINC